MSGISSLDKIIHIEEHQAGAPSQQWCTFIFQKRKIIQTRVESGFQVAKFRQHLPHRSAPNGGRVDESINGCKDSDQAGLLHAGDAARRHSREQWSLFTGVVVGLTKGRTHIHYDHLIAQAAQQLEGEVHSRSCRSRRISLQLLSVRVAMAKQDPSCLGLPRLANFLLLLGQDKPGRNNSLGERLLN